MLIVDREMEPVTELRVDQEVYITYNEDYYPYVVKDNGLGYKWLKSQYGSVAAGIDGPDHEGHYHSSYFLDLRRIHLMDFN